LGESSILTFTSFVAAIILVNISLPLFNQLLGQTIPFNIIFSGFLLPGMMLTALLIGALSGLYPAFVLSAIPPVKALKGGLLKNAKTGSLLRNTLVVGQFVAAIVLTIGSMVIYQQLQYIQSKKLGYNREQVVYLSYKQEGVFEKVPLIRNELLRHQNIEKVSFGRYLPLNMDSQTTAEEWEGNEAQAELSIYRNYVDPHFVDLFEMELVEGRSFSAEHQTNSIRSYLLNESALAALGWTSAVGKQFRKGQVIGVVKDFHFQPFNLSIKPLFLAMQKPNTADQGHVILKVKMAEIEETLAFVQETMKSILPQAPFEYGFLDESYAELYGAEIRLGKVFSIFTLLALLIACLGLFGLITNQVLQRRKEIGIRKVIGATLSNIVMLLSKDFLRLVILATLIAFPLAWWGTNRWLDDFVYHIEARWWIFALAGLTILFVALLTVGFQSARAAMANPIQSLKTE
ncbi:MAG: FtsX-like permease family protein, partial [Bacteroidota bacterium]